MCQSPIRVTLRSKHLHPSVTVKLFDPILQEEETRWLEASLGIAPLREDLVGKYTVGASHSRALPHPQTPTTGHTLFYLPHCDVQLYSNLLWANWGVRQLSCMSIIGNSFRGWVSAWAAGDASHSGTLTPPSVDECARTPQTS